MSINNIKDSNYVIYHMFADEYINSIFKNPIILFMKNLSRFFILAFWHAYLFIINFHTFFKVYKNKVLYLCISKNNYNVLKPIYEKHPKRSLFINSDFRNKSNNDILFPKFFPILLSCFFLPINLLRILQFDSQTRKRTILFLHEYILESGYNIFFYLFFKFTNPLKIVVANDHVQLTRIVIKKAKLFKINTYYLQNGCITSLFPPLSTDYALLEGNYSKDIYKNKNYNKTVIHVIGMTKFDNYKYSINYNKTVKSIGICTTSTSSYMDIKYIINLLLNKFTNLNIYLRPHPTEIIDKKYIDYYENNLINISDSNLVHPFDFLKDVDAIISGNSAILLEAALLNIFPIYYFSDSSILKYNDNHYDRYGFVKNNVACEVNNIEDLGAVIKNIVLSKPNIQKNADYYCLSEDINQTVSASSKASTIIYDI